MAHDQPAVPAPFVALIAATAAVQFFNLPVETIGDRFGPISGSLPHPSLPRVPFAMIGSLMVPAFTIALLAGIRSLVIWQASRVEAAVRRAGG